MSITVVVRGITLNTKKSNQAIDYVVIRIRFTLVKSETLHLTSDIHHAWGFILAKNNQTKANGWVQHSDEYLFKHSSMSEKHKIM